jgi:asparagine synthetase B (glutamine-hydrolysing)
MKNIDQIIVDYVDKNTQGIDEVAVLLSAGTDSITCALAAHRLGKKVTGYSMYVDGKQTSDSLGAKEVADHFGWDFVGVDVPVDNIEQDFFTLINKYGCKKKTQVECTFPFLYVYPKIKEKAVISGVAADGWYGVSKKANIHFKHTKELFDKFRMDYFGAENPAGVRQQEQLAKEYDIKFLAPYLNCNVASWMMEHDWDFFNKPTQKGPIRDAFYEIKEIKKRPHENLQLVAGIPDYFEKLLDNHTINVYHRDRVMDLVRDWQDVGPTLF